MDEVKHCRDLLKILIEVERQNTTITRLRRDLAAANGMLDEVEEARGDLRDNVSSLKSEDWKAFAGILGRFRDYVDEILAKRKDEERKVGRE